MFDSSDVKKNKIFAAIGYIGVLCFVPLFLRQKSSFAQAHAKQGLILFIAEVIAFFINIVPFLGQIIWFFLGLFFLAMSVVGIYKALSGEKWTVPLIGKYAKQIKL